MESKAGRLSPCFFVFGRQRMRQGRTPRAPTLPLFVPRPRGGGRRNRRTPAMPISINSNTIALQAGQNLQLTSASFTQAVQRLSSGLRINSAADDPAGLGLSQKLVAQINGFDQAQRNTQDAISLLQTAQSGITETIDRKSTRLNSS